MLITVELDELNFERIQNYVSLAGLDWQLYWRDPWYKICLIECSEKDSTWIELLA